MAAAKLFLMDELKQVLQNIGGSIQELENTQRSMSRDLKAAQTKLDAAGARSDDLATQMGDLRGAFAGLGAIVERLWKMHEDHEARITALERKAS